MRRLIVAGPLLERVKVPGHLLYSNLDEFCMYPCSGLKQQVEAGEARLCADGLTPAEQLVEIFKKWRPLIDKQMYCWREELLPGTGSSRYSDNSLDGLQPAEKAEIDAYYTRTSFL
jgi:polyphosphate kinase